MELRGIIVDECGTVRKFCDDYSESEIEEILENHPEWYMTTVEIQIGVMKNEMEYST